ncbi:MAG: UDP-4-amino-4,6-dideoxy-N-acetyl-beta-L-altrosamine transaminase [Alphaproteobacteria bacterium]|nr:UDP-4-amino-4,6-dideoxy-N-acetyl-beta-L-altrosamine transaminase [Alphaproteobacteria bacterium]MBL6945292.1 UDP-4-amino-4,6-dideoxy-N-acetyl-beta-L-altrosamine transaminase [Rhodospirillales bacterium]
MSGSAPFLPYGRQWIDDDDIAAVAQALRGDFLTTGPMVDKFEQAFAERVGARFAVVCTSGTAAQHLTTLALELKPGDTAIVPAVTFLSTANCARYVGTEVVFADVDPDTGLMEAEHLREALSRATNAGAVFPVHLTGQCANMQAIHDLARQHGLTIVEDACHAIGTTYETQDNKTIAVGACAHSDMAVFSLHPVKTITMGEGGVITTNDAALAARLKRLRSHGMTREAGRFVNSDLALDGTGETNPWYYEMAEVGFNYRAPDINCALGLSQLSKLDRFVAARRALVAHYDRRLAPLAPRIKPLSKTACAPGWHLYVALIDFKAAGMERAELMAKLHERGIGSQVHYIPVHVQPYYRDRYGDTELPGAMTYYDRCLSLPLFPEMSTDDADRVVDALANLMGP